MTGKSGKYPPELRERAVRMVAEIRGDHSSEWAAIGAVASMLGVRTPETVRKWVRRAQVDAGARPGVTSEESEQVKRLRRENFELRRANEILKAASTYYEARHRALSSRAARDEDLKVKIAAAHKSNYSFYGARKVWLGLNRKGTPVARCTVERLMKTLGLQGARRGKRVRTTVPDQSAARPATWSTATSTRWTRTGPGSRTSPTAPPGRGWSTSHSSSTPTPGGSWAGGPRGT